MDGFVTLVGAGPGDPGLMTLKGLQALESAQVVVYDRLVSPEILERIPAEAERIDVGKEASHHKIPQEQINRILLEKALEGKRVVRLKGGDPFLFGRGGEELELLRENGVPFAEVPGISSAIAVPAYGGIPVTHRDYSSSLHIITGHARQGKPLDIDFDALVRTKGTLVFLMGVTALPQITAGLLSAGMDPKTPGAIVENGTLACQRRLSAPLGTLAQEAARREIHSPAVIIVGQVCGLAEDFCWFDRLPLRGKRCLVTRPKERAGTLSRRLRELGAEVTEYPCIQTLPILPNPALETALESLAQYEWLCLTSPAGAGYLWDALERLGKDARHLGAVKLAAIGPGTAAALAEHGLRADLTPELWDAAHLGQALAASARGRVLILRAEEGSKALTQALDCGKIEYTDCPLYRTVYDNPRSEPLRRAVAAGEYDYVTFTSASTVKGFAAAVGEDGDFRRITGLCIGKQTAAEAQRHHIPVKIAGNATLDALTALAVEQNKE